MRYEIFLLVKMMKNGCHRGFPVHSLCCGHQTGKELSDTKMKTSTNRMNRLQSSFNNQQPIISPSTAHHPAAAANHFPIIGQSFRYYRPIISPSSANHPIISAQ
ncbi:MAG: hypothetical protein PUD58_04685 [Prevotella sp.]|uniref:hypothetical protein n=1 Tax=Prevotella sp. TaxID=59823 RepID=UPI0025869F2A|nr:hypothetical protein [Prevotella sp.]MDD6853588.1 hypothetical protein [Prevotella sp.]